MKILVFGGRDYDNLQRVFRVLDDLSRQYSKSDIEIITGGCPTGADQLAGSWSVISLGVPAREFKANWDKYGYAAGPIRNQQMVDEAKPDLGVGFPGNRGTADMARRLRRAGIKVMEIKDA